ncbi:4-oxalocrotonate decarboxylase [Rhodococcus sp. HM1]|uniref:2-keto-4-pentenoate hydratase n=1 Tax=unclassified Rhodococcus (in: high G+C Gram-positive bacteria) TaxID=192944 RepID=UPI0018CDA21B|nr:MULTISPECIES: 4-oxalocrotonate decarboxylase [unclassified Rhodococcus (in: high G+C Gram-positive bacteria)]MBH0120155.1 4-oxalocrotonate decarboxylase [Rhodococcus sp. CX]MCK8673267.1 4-oxalocrotonate decarboxylase [Rhodococcus sp. HM1]
MLLDMIDTDRLIDRLDCAQQTVSDTRSLADSHEIDIDDAYRIQNGVVSRRLGRGESIIGVKLGFTSKAKMAQMGISDVIVGQLTDAMQIGDGDDVDLARFIHPKIEPEIAYRLARDVDLADPSVDIESCVDAVAPAMEIIDSRYRDFRFTYTDVVADNTSAAGFAIGQWRPIEEVNNRTVRLEMGERIALGSTAAILGNPVRALHALVDMARRRTIALRAGQVILAGAAAAAVPMTADTAMCHIVGLGGVSVKGTK